MITKEQIIDKLNNGEELSLEEEHIYLVEAIGYDTASAKRILAIAGNTKENVIID